MAVEVLKVQEYHRVLENKLNFNKWREMTPSSMGRGKKIPLTNFPV